MNLFRIILHGHLCSADEVILAALEDFHEVCGESCYADNKVFVVLRMLLSVSQSVAGHNVDLELHAALLEVCLHDSAQLHCAVGSL